MKLICSILVLFLCIVSFALGAQMIYPADPNHPGKCYAETFGELNYLQTIYTKPCGRASCNNNGQIILHTCGVVRAECGTVQDLSKNYPECCPRPKQC